MTQGEGARAAERIENPFRSGTTSADPPKAASARSGVPSQGAPARPEAPTRRAARAEEPSAPGLGLEVRAMTGYEEEVVERRRGDANTAALCNELVARCLVAPGADHAAAYERVRALLVAERDVALIALRRASFGDLVELEIACPACQQTNEIDFPLGSLPVSLGSSPGSRPRAIEAVLSDGTRVAMLLPTAGDQEDLLDADLETASERRTFLLGRAIERFGDRSGPFDFEFARALSVSTRSALEEALDAAIPDLDLSMAVTCTACDRAFSAPFDVASFFLPR